MGLAKNQSWNIIVNWMRDASKGYQIERDSDLRLEVVDFHLKALKYDIAKLGNPEKVRVLNLFRQEVRKVERGLARIMGDDIEMQKDISQLALSPANLYRLMKFRLIKKGLEELEGIVGSTVAVLHQEAAEQESKILKTKPNIWFDFQSTPPQVAGGRVVIDVQPIDLDKIKKDLRLNIGQDIENLEVMNATLNTALELLKQGDYRQTIAVTMAILDSFPPPSIDGQKNYWDTLNPEGLDRMSKYLTDCTEILWEAQLRLGEPHLWPEQRVQLFTTRAILMKLMRNKSEAIAANHHLVLPPHPWAVEEIKAVAAECAKKGVSEKEAINLLYDDFGCDCAQVWDSIAFERYLPSTDALMDRKLTIAARALEEMSSERSIRANARLDDWGHIDRGINEIYRGQPTSELSNPDCLLLGNIELFCRCYKDPAYSPDGYAEVFSENRDGMIQKFGEMDRNNSKFLPPQLIDLRRHVVMAQCLMHPEFSIYLNFASGNKGKAEAAIWFMDRQSKANKMGKSFEEKTKKEGTCNAQT